MRDTAYDKLIPLLVAKVREEIYEWRNKGYPGASPTSTALLRWWFETDHLIDNANGSRSPFRFFFFHREAGRTVFRSKAIPVHLRPRRRCCVGGLKPII